MSAWRSMSSSGMPVGGIFTIDVPSAARAAGRQLSPSRRSLLLTMAAFRQQHRRARSCSRARGCCPASCSASAASARRASSPSMRFFSSPANRRMKKLASGDDVVLPLAQRRHLDRDDVQPVVQVLAELSVRHHGRQDRGWSRRSARTSTRSVRVPPRRSNSCSCRTRRILACVFALMSPISSRNSVPPSACSKRPMRCLSAPGERALLVAEQLGLEQVLLQGRAVHLDEVPRRRAASCGGSPRRSAPCRCPSRRG